MKYFRKIEIGDAVEEGDLDESGQPELREIRVRDIPEYQSAMRTIAELNQKLQASKNGGGDAA